MNWTRTYTRAPGIDGRKVAPPRRGCAVRMGQSNPIRSIEQKPRIRKVRKGVTHRLSLEFEKSLEGRGLKCKKLSWSISSAIPSLGT